MAASRGVALCYGRWVSSGIAELRARLTRRRLLALGVGVGALTLAGSAGWLLSLPTPAPGRLALTAVEAEILVRLGEVWFPPGNPLGVAAGDVDLAAELDALVAVLAPREQRAVHALLRVIDQLPRAGFSSWRAFRELPLADRRDLMVAWESSLGPKRQLASLLRVLVGLAFFEDERVRRAVGHTLGCPVPLPVTG